MYREINFKYFNKLRDLVKVYLTETAILCLAASEGERLESAVSAGRARPATLETTTLYSLSYYVLRNFVTAFARAARRQWEIK
jgi:hypothetical protein